jgi:hypothetical protein
MQAHQIDLRGNVLRHVAIGLLLLGITPAIVFGQGEAAGQGKPLLFHPQRLAPGARWTSAGLTSVAPPPEITEEFQVRWPAFDYHTLYGLPSGFSLDGRAAVQVLQNRISVGPKWVSTLGPVSFSLGWDIAYWFGFLKVGGFDSKAHGWEGNPNISFGYDFGNVAATFKTEVLSNYSFVSYQGDLELSSTAKFYSGIAFSFILEQPFWKDQYLTLGFRAMYTKFYWETWSLFSTFDRYLFYPEIIVGFIL